MRFAFLIIGLMMCVAFPVRAQVDVSRQETLLGLHYIPASYQSLTRLTWRFNLHPLSDDAAIDDYMRITNCPLYRNYYEHDFLWQRVREGVRRDIRYYSSHFPDRFEMTGGIELGRYDFPTSSFIVPEKYSLSRAGYLEIPIDNVWESICTESYRSRLFPMFIRLSADNPFSLTHIPVPPNEAKPLIERLSTYRYKNVYTDRMAMMRVRVRMTGIRTYAPDSISPHLVYRGQLDEIAIFEDPAMTKLIWKKTFKDLN